MSAHLIKRYVWLVDTIARAEAISFNDLDSKWQRSSLNETGEELPKRTFNNHKSKVEELFDIGIVCNPKDGYKYSIANASESELSQTQTWLFNSFSISNVLNVGNKVNDRIQLENIPSGQKYLQEIVECISKGKKIQITYQKFTTKVPKKVVVSPYFVKLFKQRWYVVAVDGKTNSLKTYGLDRITDVVTQTDNFDFPLNFSAEEYYKDSFGIIHNDEMASEKVILKVTRSQANYLESLPLHHSQKLINGGTSDAQFSLFEYQLVPTYDFKQEILSKGADVEVISPAWFKEEIVAEITKLAKMYS